MHDNSALLSTRDAAAYLALSPRTLEKWRTRGVGPAYSRIGRRVVYRLDDLDKLVAAGVVGGGAA